MRPRVLSQADGLRTTPSRERLSVAAAALMGAACALFASCATLSEPKFFVVSLVVLGALAVWPIISYLNVDLAQVLLFLVAFTASISLKFHPIFRQDHIGGSIGLRISITDLLLLALIVVVMWRSSGSSLRLQMNRWLMVAFAAYIAWVAVSAFFASDKVLALFQLVSDVQAFLVFIILTEYITTLGRWRTFVSGLMLALCLQSAVTIIQHQRPGALALSFLGGTEDLTAVEGAGEQAERDYGTIYVGDEAQVRPTGMLIHPNVLAFYFILALPLALGTLIGERGTLSALSFAALTMGATAMYMTLSRSAWTGLTVASLLASALLFPSAIKRLPKKALLVVMAVSVTVGVVWQSGKIYERFVLNASESIDFRSELNAVSLRMVADHPWFGVGLNSFEHELEAYDTTGEFSFRQFPAHNIFLLSASETGLPGGLLFIVLVVVMTVTSIQNARRCTGDLRWSAVLVATAIAGFWVTQLTDFAYRIPVLSVLFWMHLALPNCAANCSPEVQL